MRRCARVWLPSGPRGQRLDGPYFLALLAEAYGKVGQVEEGLTVLAEALAVVDKTGERFYEAELYRLKGRTDAAKVISRQLSVVSYRSSTPEPRPPSRSRSVFSQSHRNRAEAASQVAGTARRDEPRASVAATRQARAEAHKMLSEIYNWFTEGFDTKDLQEAKRLLESIEGKDGVEPKD